MLSLYGQIFDFRSLMSKVDKVEGVQHDSYGQISFDFRSLMSKVDKVEGVQHWRFVRANIV